MKRSEINAVIIGDNFQNNHDESLHRLLCNEYLAAEN